MCTHSSGARGLMSQCHRARFPPELQGMVLPALPAFGAFGVPGLVAMSLQPFSIITSPLPVSVCVSPLCVSYKDTCRWIIQGDLVAGFLTNYIHKDPFFSMSHSQALGLRMWTHLFGVTPEHSHRSLWCPHCTDEKPSRARALSRAPVAGSHPHGAAHPAPPGCSPPHPPASCPLSWAFMWILQQGWSGRRPEGLGEGCGAEGRLPSLSFHVVPAGISVHLTVTERTLCKRYSF